MPEEENPFLLIRIEGDFGVGVSTLAIKAGGDSPPACMAIHHPLRYTLQSKKIAINGIVIDSKISIGDRTNPSRAVPLTREDLFF